MSEQEITVTLKTEPDGYGFIYGQAWRGDCTFAINVVPPQAHWRGQWMLNGYEPHASDWVFYVDGNDVGRLTGEPDLEAEFIKLLRPE
ncbi:MAG: hypothetical protein ACFCUR_07355 [Rhodomicrobiaceae bacterium]